MQAEGRVLVVAAHPDDEVIGLGGRMPELPELHLLHVTDGAPRNMADAAAHGFATREAYAAARRAEAEAALALAGVPADRLRRLEVPDQEASFGMVKLARRLAEFLRELRPAAVYSHPYEGGHPDHDATALALQSALLLLRRGRLAAPRLLEFAGYHARGGAMAAGEFLPHPAAPVSSVRLPAEAYRRKCRMLDCFATQRETLRPFYRDTEAWRPAPAYDFTAPPHPGALYYDRFPWGVGSERWRELARAALLELELERAA